jgi:Uma2 family endonuclease
MAIQAQSPTLTVASFERLLADPANAERRLELVDGEIVEKMTTEEHGICVANIQGHLWNYLRAHPIGRVMPEVHFRPADGAPTVFLPDVAVRLTTQPPARQGFVSEFPDLAVEVKSAANSLKALRNKAAFYLDHGTRAVWIVIPSKRLVEVYGPDSVDILTVNDLLDAPDLLAGFQMPVSAIFEGIPVE